MITVTLKNISSARKEKFEKCLQLIDLGLKNQMIYNVDFKVVKENVGRAIAESFSKMKSNFRDHNKMEDYDRELWDMLWYLSMDSIASVRAFNNKIKKSKQPIPKEYVDFATNLLPLVEAMTELKNYIVKGRKPSTTPKKTVENPNKISMTCACCGRKIAITKSGRMVNHGFHRPGYGWIVGNCIGVASKPLEVSPEGLIWLATELQNRAVQLELKLADIKRVGKVTIKDHYSAPKDFEVGTYRYNDEIKRIKRDIDSLKERVEQHRKEIEDWKPNAEGVRIWENRENR